MINRQPAGTVAVLLAVERHEPLVEWALAAREGRQFDAKLAHPLFSKCAPDLSFVPMPAPSAAEAAIHGRMASADLNASERLIVRAYIAARHPLDIPHAIDDAVVYSDPVITGHRTCGDSDPVKSSAHVAAKLRLAQLHAAGMDGEGVAIAIVDNGVFAPRLTQMLGQVSFSVEDSWKPENLGLGPGQYPLDHGTMCAYDALLAAPRATILDYPVLLARGPNDHAAEPTVSAAIAGYARLQQMWAANLAQANPKYRALVVNNSWGIFHKGLDFFPSNHPGRYVDNPNHPFRKSVRALADAGADVLFAAGNCGAGCPDDRCAGHVTGSIMGANAYTEVLTIAGCDADDARVDYSSQGPSIANMPQEKPDVTSYTHFKGSEVFGSGTPDGGTSTACAVAAGCIAALRTRIAPAQVPPADLFASARGTARQLGKGWNGDFGYGILDPAAIATSKGLLAPGLVRRGPVAMEVSRALVGVAEPATVEASATPPEDEMVLLEVTGRGRRPPTRAEAAKQLNIAPSDIDSDYGIIASNRAKSLYVVRARRASTAKTPPDRGPYSDPKIATFGSPRKRKK